MINEMRRKVTYSLRLTAYGFMVVSCLLLVVSFLGCAPAKKEVQKDGKKVIFYRNPMNPQITSPVFMKDEMGMDYIPVYAEEIAGEGIKISSEQQKLIGVKTEKIAFRNLFKEIRTVGTVAYDPELYVAQQEFIGALDLNAAGLIEAAKTRLGILGLSEAQINELIKTKQAQTNLILPEGRSWIYITIYEYESGLIKKGLPIEIETVAYPGEKFEGKIAAVSSVLDPMTRSIKVRAEVNNPENKLKPGMYADAVIKVDLGRKLALPEEALIDTGKRKVVVIISGADNFISRAVKIGQKAEGFYAILGGLKAGETVVTAGNFLIDSESRLKSAAPAEHKPGQ